MWLGVWFVPSGWSFFGARNAAGLTCSRCTTILPSWQVAWLPGQLPVSLVHVTARVVQAPVAPRLTSQSFSLLLGHAPHSTTTACGPHHYVAPNALLPARSHPSRGYCHLPRRSFKPSPLGMLRATLACCWRSQRPATDHFCARVWPTALLDRALVVFVSLCSPAPACALRRPRAPRAVLISRLFLLRR